MMFKLAGGGSIQLAPLSNFFALRTASTLIWDDDYEYVDRMRNIITWYAFRVNAERAKRLSPKNG